MTVLISACFGFEFESPTDALLQFEVADLPEQRVHDVDTQISRCEHRAAVPAQDDIGQRIWLRANGRIEVDYSCTVDPDRIVTPMHDLSALPLHQLPGEAVQYLLDSRYCRADHYQSLVSSEFDGTSGGARIAAIRDWIAEHFDYVPGASDANTDATDTFIARQGICRDYSHVMVMLSRASGIPARYVACFAPGVDPQDFHAATQVFLADPTIPGGGMWQLVDATGMADLEQTAIIGVGRDAADVSFLTTFGPMQFQYSKVEVSTAN